MYIQKDLLKIFNKDKTGRAGGSAKLSLEFSAVETQHLKYKNKMNI